MTASPYSVKNPGNSSIERSQLPISKKSPFHDTILELLFITNNNKDRNKVYSAHAPEVECISKGKPTRNMSLVVKSAWRQPAEVVGLSEQKRSIGTFIMATPYQCYPERCWYEVYKAAQLGS